MESIINFIDEHFIIFLILLIIILILTAFLIFKGFSFETKTGNKIKIGGISKRKKYDDDKTDSERKEEELKSYMLINILVNSWKKKLSMKLDKLKNGIVGDCIRHANGLINKYMTELKQKYIELVNKENRLNTSEDGYKTIIFNLLIDKASEDLKTFLCSLIREDHFETKTKEEIKQICENCNVILDDILNAIDFNRDILLILKKDCANNISDMADDIINVSSKKYEILKEEKKEIILDSQDEVREELKIKFDFLLSDCDLDLLTEYDE